jgi:FlaA1/EpsC-like NDP-sugar epimerase
VADAGILGNDNPSTKKRVGRFFEEHRLVIQAGFDCLAWAFSIPAALILRYEFELSPKMWGPFRPGGLAVAVSAACLLQFTIGLALGLYRGRWRYGSFEEVAHLARSAAVVTVLLGVVNAIASRRLVPVSVVFAGGLIALLSMAAIRYTWRLVLEKSRRPTGESATRVLVFGAGEAGAQLLTSMLRNPASPYIPVGLLDDDPTKRNLNIMGVPMLGDRTAIPRAAQRSGATALIIAVPEAGGDMVRQLSDLALDADLDLKILPPLEELLDGVVGLGDVRAVTEVDLLGRHEIDTDIDAIAGYLTGKRVLVTGAGGSIGSELCRQISRFAPAQLAMLDRDESALHGVQLAIEGRAMLDSRNLIVADIRDERRLREVFDEHKPEVVFHAAALKHLPLLEMHPREAFKTNVIGTQLLLDVSRDHEVVRFINISTDKAADPVSVLGYSKRIAERLTAAAAAQSVGTCLSVRFGNVLGSRGSVLTAFRAQVDAGGPITVTHPDVTRFFMTVEEAVQLVIQAGAVGRDGEALVLDMGEPVRIDDVARRLAAQAQRPVDVVYTGLRPGEKLHEVLFGADERGETPGHPRIAHVCVSPLAPESVYALPDDLDDAELVAALQRLTSDTTQPESAQEPAGPDS